LNKFNAASHAPCLLSAYRSIN